ncbi:MAG: hypothetical protein ACD_2C00220G0007 [uncultured bacterium (gcode 4)]|uniref:Uncharacterized protein n=1 Tax=uncultured bacterium (gcode 4) TaxID=1234023 RepID=K2GFS9_9BACT|nr:MAG: hypothetical protein ACD_2C00220G0007 [uncultured bacterium (gcode 4)]
MLELNLTWLQITNTAQDISEEKITQEEEAISIIQESPTAPEVAPLGKAAESKPKLSLSLNSLMWKPEPQVTEPEILTQDDQSDKTISDTPAEAVGDTIESVVSEDQEMISDAIPETISEKTEEIKEESSSILSITSLKETEEGIRNEAAEEVNRKNALIAKEKEPEEEKKEFFPGFNALWDFGNEDILGLNKKEDDWIQWESVSIFKPKEEEVPVAEIVDAPVEQVIQVAEEQLVATEVAEEDASLLLLDTASAQPETSSEPVISQNPEEIKEELSKKRLFAWLEPFKKKILIYSVAILTIWSVSITWFMTFNRAPDIKANINEIKLPPIKFKEWVDFNIIKNVKKNIKKTNPSVVVTGSGETIAAPVSGLPGGEPMNASGGQPEWMMPPPPAQEIAPPSWIFPAPPPAN